MKSNDEKTSINELFNTMYPKQLADLLDEIEITEIDEDSPPKKRTDLAKDIVERPPDKKQNDIVISDIEVGPTKLKIGKVEFKGKLAKFTLVAVVVLASVGMFGGMF